MRHKYYFYWYLHDDGPDNDGDLAEAAAELVSFQFPLTESLRDGTEGRLTKARAKEILEARPFYEVRLMCEYDSVTKRVTIMGAKGVTEFGYEQERK